MSRLIDADALMDEARSFSRTVLYGKNLCFQEDAVMMKHLVEMVNTRVIKDFGEAVPVVHGHWIRGGAYPHHIFCSNCYRTYVPNDESEMWKDQTRLPRKYCPECGAKMDEVTE